MEVINMDPEVMHFMDTLLCTDISTPVTGQLALDLMLHPPRPGDPSYDAHAQVRTDQKPSRAVDVVPFLHLHPVVFIAKRRPGLFMPL